MLILLYFQVCYLHPDGNTQARTCKKAGRGGVTALFCLGSANVYQTQTHIQWLRHHAMTGVHSECTCCKCETSRGRSHESCALKIPSSMQKDSIAWPSRTTPTLLMTVIGHVTRYDLASLTWRVARPY